MSQIKKQTVKVPQPSAHQPSDNYTIELTAFTCGAVVMILEIVASRVLAPFLGTSIYVWTSLIGSILLFLSLGYWIGGQFADRAASLNRLALIVFLAGLLIGLSSILGFLILSVIDRAIGDLRLGATVASVVLFGVPTFLLGMVTPICAKLKINQMAHSGKTIGQLYALSTLGSILGTFLAGYVLISLLGTTTLLLSLGAVLVANSVILAGRHLIVEKLLTMMLIGLTTAGQRQLQVEQAQAGYRDIDTRYQRVSIIDQKGKTPADTIRLLMTDPGIVQSGVKISDPNELAITYTKFYRLANHFYTSPKRALFLGGGGFSAPRDFLKHNSTASLDVVEIDPQITELARQFFFLGEDPRLTIYHADGRAFLNRMASTPTYDVVFVDTFKSSASPPFQLSTLETVDKIYKLLTPKGIVLVNVFSSIQGKTGKFLQSMYATYRSAFEQVLLFPVDKVSEPNKIQNIILVALKSSAPVGPETNEELQSYLAHLWRGTVPAGQLFTDDFAPAEEYLLPTTQAIREHQRSNFGS